MKPFCSLFSLLLVQATMAQPDTAARPALLQEVVVTGQYQAQSLKNSVYRIRVIGQERLRLQGASSLQQVLSNEIGFRFSNDNTLGTSDVELMGMSGRNVKILLDGVPLADRGDTRESLGQVDINSIERVEVVEGPMSVLYGSDALAGVINIITKKHAPGRFGLRAKVQEETAATEYYPFSYRGLHQQNADASLQGKHWSVNAGGTHYDFNGWGGDAYGRTRNWKPKEQWLGHARVGYAAGDLRVYYRLDGLQEDIVSRGAIGQTYKALDQRYRSRRYLHQVQGDWSVNERMKVNTILSYTDYKRQTRTTEHDFTTGSDQLTSGAGEQDASTLNAALFRTTVQNRFSGALAMQAGIDINREQAGGQRIQGTPVITDYALFISSEIQPKSSVNIRPGLRFIKNSVYKAPPVIPSLNTKFSLSKLFDLRLAYAYGFRAPALRELYFNYYDANHNIVGNPGLKAEHSNSFNAALSFTKAAGENRFGSTLSAYYNRFRNLINYAVNPADPQQYKMVNIDQFRTAGVMLENTYSSKQLEATVGAGYLARYNRFAGDAQYKSQGLHRFMWSPEVNTNLAYTFQKPCIRLGLFYKFTGRRPGYVLATDINGQQQVQQTRIAPFHLADLTASKDLLSYCTLSTGVRNLFDVTTLSSTILDNGAAHSGGGPVPLSYGRSYFLSLSFQWNRK